MLLLAACQAGRFVPLPATLRAVHLTHGIAAGEVSATSLTVWGRCDQPSTLTVRLRDAERAQEWSRSVAVKAERDFTGTVGFDGLTPGTTYQYAAGCAAGHAPSTGEMEGTLRTAPAPSAPAAVRFVWSGDVGGQNACRDTTDGYAIFDQIAARAPDFFVALGDMIYADDPCLARGRFGNTQIPGPPAPATERPMFWEVWKYNRSDPALRRLFAQTPYYAVWDDHEIVNDSGPHSDTLPDAPDHHLLPIARDAFLDYQPLQPPAAEPTRLYRSVRWGQQLEVFFLDTRQYRDANSEPDSAQKPKTMLGAAQRRWLIEAITQSTATWKVIVSSVPMSIPTGTDAARDGWANLGSRTGFERELLSILQALQRRGVRNQVWLTTDVHFATGFRDTPFPGDPQFTLHEFVCGPLNAGVFPKDDLDPTLHPQRLFFHGPASADAIRNFDEAKAWFNFGQIEIDGAGKLTVEIVNGNGTVVYHDTLAPATLRKSSLTR